MRTGLVSICHILVCDATCLVCCGAIWSVISGIIFTYGRRCAGSESELSAWNVSSCAWYVSASAHVCARVCSSAEACVAGEVVDAWGGRNFGCHHDGVTRWLFVRPTGPCICTTTDSPVASRQRWATKPIFGQACAAACVTKCSTSGWGMCLMIALRCALADHMAVVNSVLAVQNPGMSRWLLRKRHVI
jgi:hypothetical protein